MNILLSASCCLSFALMAVNSTGNCEVRRLTQTVLLSYIGLKNLEECLFEMIKPHYGLKECGAAVERLLKLRAPGCNNFAVFLAGLDDRGTMATWAFKSNITGGFSFNKVVSFWKENSFPEKASISFAAADQTLFNKISSDLNAILILVWELLQAAPGLDFKKMPKWLQAVKLMAGVYGVIAYLENYNGLDPACRISCLTHSGMGRIDYWGTEQDVCVLDLFNNPMKMRGDVKETIKRLRKLLVKQSWAEQNQEIKKVWGNEKMSELGLTVTGLEEIRQQLKPEIVSISGFKDGATINVAVRPVNMAAIMVELGGGSYAKALEKAKAKAREGKNVATIAQEITEEFPEEMAAEIQDHDTDLTKKLPLLQAVARAALVEPTYEDLVSVAPLNLVQLTEIFNYATD